MIIFAGDYVKTRADGAWHLVKHINSDTLILLDNGFLTYAHELHIDACLSADEYEVYEYNKRADARRQAWVDKEFAA
jgi:hypothetical protein